MADLGRIACSVFLVLGIVCVAGHAGAQGESHEPVALLVQVGAVAALVAPSEVGADLAASEAKPQTRLRIGGSYSAPLCKNLGWIDPPVTATLARACAHRVVLAGRLAIAEDVPVTFDPRVGYRYRVPHAGEVPQLVVPFFGLGSTVEVWPVPRPSISPEVGLHLGRDGFFPGGSLTLQADAYGGRDPNLRIALLVGWTLL